MRSYNVSSVARVYRTEGDFRSSSETVTSEYIPKYTDVNEIVSDYWTDILIRLSIALTKIALGRVRSRFTQSNALWAQDGEAMLEEGNTRLTALREQLVASTQLIYPID